MFFLLAAFMLVSLSMANIERVPIKVPQAASGVAEKNAPPIHIAIDAHGIVTWGSEIVTPGDITQRLAANQAEANESGVLIGADDDARHGPVLAVMDAIRLAGVEKIGFESKQPGQ